MDKCIKCGSTSNLHTHHIKEQRESVNGFINDMHKNVGQNLTILCESCHQKLHANNESIQSIQCPTGEIIDLSAKMTN